MVWHSHGILHSCLKGCVYYVAIWKCADACQVKRQKTKLNTKTMYKGVPWWLSGLTIWCYHYCGLGHCCGSSMTPGPGSHTCHRCSQKKKKKIMYKNHIEENPARKKRENGNSSCVCTSWIWMIFFSFQVSMPVIFNGGRASMWFQRTPKTVCHKWTKHEFGH